MDLIWTHPSGGELWQGDSDDVDTLDCMALAEKPSQIKVIALMAMNVQPPMHRRYKVIRARLIDEPVMAPDAVALTAGIADTVATDLARHLELGESVLSSCRAGRNRSGLVSAITLMKAGGFDSEEAIKLVRSRRKLSDGPALNNMLFVKIIHELFRSGGSQDYWARVRESLRTEHH